MRRTLNVAGAGLITVGVVILLFVVYQVWGTGLIAEREQRALRRQFDRALQSAPPPGSAPQPVVPETAVARLEIPAIELDQAVIEGVDADDLHRGPGHDPGTPLPGRVGNAAIAGHRTTYGGPFNRLDELASGDRIDVTTLEGRFVYRVTEIDVVDPSDVGVLDATADARLTLTTCHPKYSARQRLVVVAGLDPRMGAEALPSVAVTPVRLKDVDAGVASGWAGVDQGMGLWTVALALVGFGWWTLHRGRRHWLVSVAGALPVLIVLFFFFAQVEAVLPPNF